MVRTMICNSDLVDVCKALFLCEQLHGNVDNWDNLNKCWHNICRDRRYNLYYGNNRDNGDGLWWIGEPYKRNSRMVYVKRAGRELVYKVRFNDSSVFYARPCWTVDFTADKMGVFYNPCDLI